jgi:hypothetical protein
VLSGVEDSLAAEFLSLSSTRSMPAWQRARINSRSNSAMPAMIEVTPSLRTRRVVSLDLAAHKIDFGSVKRRFARASRQ